MNLGIGKERTGILFSKKNGERDTHPNFVKVKNIEPETKLQS